MCYIGFCELELDFSSIHLTQQDVLNWFSNKFFSITRRAGFFCFANVRVQYITYCIWIYRTSKSWGSAWRKINWVSSILRELERWIYHWCYRFFSWNAFGILITKVYRLKEPRPNVCTRVYKVVSVLYDSISLYTIMPTDYRIFFSLIFLPASNCPMRVLVDFKHYKFLLADT
jgi:hypothetical protein